MGGAWADNYCNQSWANCLSCTAPVVPPLHARPAREQDSTIYSRVRLDDSTEDLWWTGYLDWLYSMYCLAIGAGCEGVLCLICKLTRSYMYSIHWYNCQGYMILHSTDTGSWFNRLALSKSMHAQSMRDYNIDVGSKTLTKSINKQLFGLLMHRSCNLCWISL